VKAFEELLLVQNVQHIRIVSANRENIVNEQSKREYLRFRKEMAAKGVSVEWRVSDALFHDRYIISDGFQYNVPPVNSIFQGAYAEMLQSPNRPPFDDWFKGGVNITDAPIRATAPPPAARGGGGL
jgi:hypothetical protein